MAKRKLPFVSCNEACFACQVGNHESCEDPENCECNHLKEEPKGWRERLRERFPIFRSSRKTRDES